MSKFHNLSEALLNASWQTVSMAHEKNGGPIMLQAWREALDITQEDLAERVHTSGGMISMLETGERGLTVKWLRKLSPALGVPIGDLIDRDPSAPVQAFSILPNADELAAMVAGAQSELGVGTSLADYPRAVGPALLTRLQQFVSERQALRAQSPATSRGKGAPSRDATTPGAPE